MELNPTPQQNAILDHIRQMPPQSGRTALIMAAAEADGLIVHQRPEPVGFPVAHRCDEPIQWTSPFHIHLDYPQPPPASRWARAKADLARGIRSLRYRLGCIVAGCDLD